MIRPTTKEANEFFKEGTLAFAEIERVGMRIDIKYLDGAIVQVRNRIRKGEEGLKNTKIFKAWKTRFPEPNLQSTAQLGEVLFNVLGYKAESYTATGKAKVNEEAIEKVDDPFVAAFLKCKKLRKVLNTYLLGIQRETVNGVIRPSYNLAGSLRDDEKGGARSYRGSADSPNIQNMPIRNKRSGAIIRRCFIPRDGCRLAEVDFSTLEVRIAASVTGDRNLISYVKDKTKDMHRDTACLLFKIKPEQVEKKGTRDCAKNRFVFSQLYGSYYVDCARNIWEAIKRNKYTLANSDTLILDHLASKGIKTRGKCERGERTPPKPGTFEHHVQQVENLFWNDPKWFTQYTAWKRVWYGKYLETGIVPMPTGFTARGLYRRNQVLNLPIQGPASHCLFWSIIEIQKEIRKRSMKSRLIGHIHDCLLADVPFKETQQFLDIVHEVMTVRLLKAWQWIIVPLEVEVDMVEQGESWNEKRPWYRTDKWRPV